MNLLRLVIRLLALPGRLLIWAIDDLKRANGVPPLGRFLRGCVHTFIWFIGLVLFVSAVTPPAPTPTRSAASVRAPIHEPPAYLKPPSDPVPLAPINGARVGRVIDGDTFELADGRKVRVLGIDSCEMDTPGGREAKLVAQAKLYGMVGLSSQPGGPDADRYGRLLRYVQTDSGDFGLAMVGWDHTGVYQGDNDASPEYVAGLYAHDLDHATSPPSGRECGEDPPPVVDDGPNYTPLPDGDDDDGESRFCRKRWWC